jgi:N-acetylglucosamine kinase-like BadF-type ATPase
MSLFLAVDAGGTSTRCVAVNETGGCLGYGVAQSGNPISAGPALAATSVAASAAAALTQAGADGTEVAGVLLAMAGATTLTGTTVFAEALAPLGVAAPISYAADLLATFCSGTWREAGYALVAGTGAAAIRVECGREAVTADGLGWLLGDDGSGFWVGRRVARAVVAELDRRGPRTALTPALLHTLALHDDGLRDRGRPAVLQRLIEALYALRPVQLARFAHLAFAAADDGDELAARIVSEAADALLHTLEAVIDPRVTGPVVLGGGTVARHGELAARITAAHPGAEVVHVSDGVLGAAVLTLRQASVAVGEAAFIRVRQTLAALR